jgi:nickel transport protein
MKAALPAVLLALLLAFVASDVSAHGLSVVLERQGDVVVATCRYAGGTPVRAAAVVIRGPGEEAPYQEGRTDPQGRFAFVPAGPGEWRVTVDDGMGHRRTARITVAAAESAPAAVHEEGTSPTDAPVMAAEHTAAGAGARATDALPWRLATGLSLLLGLTGIGYGYTARARRRSGAA